MDDGTVRIHELRLRAPGLSAEEGRVLGNEVVRFLSEALCEGIRYREVAALEVKVNIPAGTPRSDLARIVSRHILGALR
jgi:hypothetical protein